MNLRKPLAAALATIALAAGAGTAAAASHPSGSHSAAKTSTTVSCRNLVATPAVKQAVTTAYEHHAASRVHLQHIAPVPGSFYYGQCGATRYAGTEFIPTKGATYQERVTLQDDGGTMKYFSAPAQGAWKYIATGAVDRNLGCNTVKQIPAALAHQWNNCPTPK